MIRFFYAFLLSAFAQISFAQNLFVADTFTYTINLDLTQNLYLKSVPVDLLKGYCKGEWNAYYPKMETNQCLFDDFLQRFESYQLNVPTNSNFCWDDYCSDPYFKELYSNFTRKLKYREIVYFDQQHSVVKREVLWLQLFYSKEEYDGWKHYNGPVFWLQEIKKASTPVQVFNKNLKSTGWTLEHEFSFPGFITNENKQQDDKKKIIDKYDKVEEN